MSGTGPGPNGGAAGAAGAAGEGNGGYDTEMASLAEAFSKANAGGRAGNASINALAAGVAGMRVNNAPFRSSVSAFPRTGKYHHCDECTFTTRNLYKLHVHGRSHADKITSLTGMMGSGGGGAGAAAGGAGAAAGGAGAAAGGWGGEEPPGGNVRKSRKSRKSRKGRKSRKSRR